MGRSYEFPTIEYFCDMGLLISSCIFFWNPAGLRMEILFSVNVVCFIIKICLVIQFNQEIGPLLKIVQKMAGDFVNFLVIYFILLAMFTIVANLIFIKDCIDFATPFEAFITLLDSSLGNYEFALFDKVTNP